MAVKHPEAKNTRRKDSRWYARTARALNVDPEWLRIGQGVPIRRDARKAATLAVYENLSPSDRGMWMAWGRILIAAAARA